MLTVAFITGLLGSFHCVGMCGPIAMMIPVSGRNHIVSKLLYNLGRSISYAIIGAIIGVLGWGIIITGYQQWLSIGVGTLLLFMAMMNFFKADSSGFYIPGLSKQVSIIKKQIGKFIQYKSYLGNFILGNLNGLLPCGLVYLGIAGAIATGHYIKGAEFMFYFGIGTVPIMYAVAFFGQFITLKYRNQIRKAMPVVVTVMAIMLIVRGLNLGIPYLSPAFEKESHEVTCCEKPNAGKAEIKCSPKNCNK